MYIMLWVALWAIVCGQYQLINISNQDQDSVKKFAGIALFAAIFLIYGFYSYFYLKNIHHFGSFN